MSFDSVPIVGSDDPGFDAGSIASRHAETGNNEVDSDSRRPTQGSQGDESPSKPLPGWCTDGINHILERRRTARGLVFPPLVAVLISNPDITPAAR
jgi:hypothetical protein